MSESISASPGPAKGPQDVLCLDDNARAARIEAIKSALAPAVEQARWCRWKYTLKKGHKKPDKFPYTANPRGWQPADSTNPTTWDTWESVTRNLSWEGVKHDAVLVLPDGSLPYLGVFLGKLDGVWLVGIDLDSCREPETGELRREAQAIVERFPGCYWEVSPSGLGVKGLGLVSRLPENGDGKFKATWEPTGKKGAEIEVYCTSRFFCVTGIEGRGTSTDITETLDTWLGELRGSKGTKRQKAEDNGRAPEPGLDGTERDVLACIPAHDEPDWFRICGAIKRRSNSSPEGLELFDWWSQRSPDQYDRAAVEERWQRSDPDRAPSWRTIVKEAKERGYKKARPDITYSPAALLNNMQDAEAAMLQKGLPIYQQSGTVVHIIGRGGRKVVLEMRKRALITYMMEAADWWVIEDDKPRQTQPPLKLAEAYLDSEWRRAVPELAGLIHAPTLRDDGTVIEAPGYDPASGLYLDTRGVEFLPLWNDTSRENALACLAKLKGILDEFPFADEASRSVALSAALTAVVRRVLPTAPFHLISAPAAGTGKTFLAHVISTCAIGAVQPPKAMPDTEGEFRKWVLGELGSGSGVILIDNVDLELASGVMCMVGTSDGYTDRQLGANINRTVSTRSLWLITGNNLVVRGDLSRRSVMCRLDAKQERPEERRFKNKNLLRDIAKHRPELVSAALAVLRAYIVAGRPGVDELKPLVGYEDWGAQVRGALVWLGEADPVDTREMIVAHDRDAEARGEFVEAVLACKPPGDPFTVGDLIKLATYTVPADNDPLELHRCYRLGEVIRSVCGNKNPRGALPPFLTRLMDVIVDGYALRYKGSEKGNRSSLYWFEEARANVLEMGPRRVAEQVEAPF